MVLTAPGGKIPKDVSWNAGKKFMGNVDAFLKSLMNFDKDNIPEKCVEGVEKVCTPPAHIPSSEPNIAVTVPAAVPSANNRVGAFALLQGICAPYNVID